METSPSLLAQDVLSPALSPFSSGVRPISNEAGSPDGGQPVARLTSPFSHGVSPIASRRSRLVG